MSDVATLWSRSVSSSAMFWDLTVRGKASSGSGEGSLGRCKMVQDGTGWHLGLGERQAVLGLWLAQSDLCSR